MGGISSDDVKETFKVLQKISSYFDKKLTKNDMDTRCIILRENSYLDTAQLTSEYKAVRFCVISFIIFIVYMLIRQQVYWDLGYILFFNVLFLTILIIFMIIQAIYLNIRFLGAFTRPRMKDTFNIGNKLKFVIKFNWLTDSILLFNLITIIGFVSVMCYCDYKIREKSNFITLYEKSELLEDAAQMLSMVQNSINELQNLKLVLMITYILLCVLVFFSLVIGMCTLRRWKEEICRIDFNNSLKECEYTIKADGISIILNDGRTETLNLEKEELTFLSGSVIVLTPSGLQTSVYREGQVKKIVVKGFHVNKEIIFNHIQKKWECN